MSRFSLKIVGAQGQGVISTGEILAKCFKRNGYCVFGYREYNSLIKGGYTSYQIDTSPSVVRSSEERVNIVIALNHHGFEHDLRTVKRDGIFVHDTDDWEFTEDDQAFLRENHIRVLRLPVADILKKLHAKPILANVVFSAFVWAACGGEMQRLKNMVGEKFAKKKDLLELNMRAIEEGFAHHASEAQGFMLALSAADEKAWSTQLLLTGSEAMGLGIIHAGCRLYAGYPMTPSSPLLSYIASVQNETGMVIKQAEDEITAVQMMSGAMLAGTRAVTATSGGGFDLMTETVSLNGIIENPAVIVLAQRPGPGTGLPTWTAQGDLLLSVFAGHGEFARCVLSVSDSDDAFYLMEEAFNIAETYQTPVIVLTDKHVAEGIYTQEPYEQKAAIERGKLIVKPAELRKLRSADRYDPAAEDGISKRWLPGSEAATYAAQGDEHNADGSVDESSKNAVEQMNKRLKKQEAMKRGLPEPLLYTNSDDVNGAFDLLIVSWGSTAGAILDVMDDPSLAGASVGYVHYEYLWPLKTESLEELVKSAKKVVLVEGNATAQLGTCIKMQCGLDIEDKILKYDGRPFFYGELLSQLIARSPSHA